MNPILVRIELGPADAPVPDFAQAQDEFRKTAEALGVPVKPSLRVTDPLEHPEAWDVAPGTEGYVAFLGALTDRDDAVEVLSRITISSSEVIDVKSLSMDEAKEFEAQARRMTEVRKKQQAQTAAAAPSGRHAARSSGQAPLSRDLAEPIEPFELMLSTPSDARKTPLPVSELGF